MIIINLFIALAIASIFMLLVLDHVFETIKVKYPTRMALMLVAGLLISTFGLVALALQIFNVSCN